MSLVYLVRHGQASAGTDDYDRLSTLGQKQAVLLGEWWAKQGFTAGLSAHGTLQRQRDTASLALSKLPRSTNSVHNVVEHVGLNEYDHTSVDQAFGLQTNGSVDGSMTFDIYLDIMQRWRDGNSHHPVHSAEPWLDFYHRGWQSVQELHASNEGHKDIVMFTSGGVIASIVSVVLNLDFVHTIDAIWRIRNSSITTLHFDGAHARLVDFNTVPHLQSHHNDSLITLI